MKKPTLAQFASRVASRLSSGEVKVEALVLDARPASPVDGLVHLEAPVSLERGSLVGVLVAAWDSIRPGGWLAVSTVGPAYESVAVATAMGWRLEDGFEPVRRRGEWVLILKRDAAFNAAALELDWQQERSHWTSRPGVIGKLTSTSTSTGGDGDKGSERRCHVFGVSIAKSGSRSLAGLFSAVRTGHEFDAARTIAWLSGGGGDGPRDKVVAWLKARDERSGFLECDSSQLHHWYLDALAEAYPEARFLMTVREPRAWIRSLIHHRLARGLSPEWEPLEAMRFGASFAPRDAAEKRLLAYGVPPLSRLYAFWAEHHRRAMEVIPRERLMIVELKDLKDRCGVVADFVGLRREELSGANAQLNEAQADFRLLDRVAEDHLQAKEKEHCEEVWQELRQRAV